MVVTQEIEMKNMQQQVGGTLASTDRRSFLRGAGLSGLALAGTAVLGEKAFGQTEAAATASFTATDVEVFNFALNLEYLEAEFYTRSLTGLTLSESGIKVKGVGNAGPTIGGKQVDFSGDFSGKLRNIVMQITKDEQTHVKLLQSLLGPLAIAKPAINLDAMDGYSSFKAFLNLARDFEDVGVSAYGGAAGLLSTAGLSYGARIALTEAYHASTLRLLVEENGVMSPAVDALDVPPPPVGTHNFTVDSQGLAIVRTTSQVLSIVYANATPGANYGGFFPRGVNGAITTV